ncbi:MAG: cell division ATPase MinD [Candidatus Altiarchaeota archaeon]
MTKEKKHKGARIISVISVKGGVGKTTTVANLGVALSTVFQKNVLVLDSNLTAPNLGLHLGLINSKVTLHDVLKGDEPISNAIHLHDSGMDVIPASLHNERVDPTRLREVIEDLRSDHDIILIDSAPGLDMELVGAIEAADEVLIVSSLDFPTISTTLKAIKLTKELGVPILGVVLNRIKDENYELSVPFVADTLEEKIIAGIPEDANCAQSVAAKSPVVTSHPRSPASLCFKKLAGKIIGVNYQVQPEVDIFNKLLVFLGLRKDPLGIALKIGS